VTAGGSSIPEVQRLAAALVAAKPTGRIAEIGTAFGAGASAMAAALAPDASFITVEPDEERYRQAREALAGSRAELVNARWEDVLLERGPFDLIFFDGGLTKPGSSRPSSCSRPAESWSRTTSPRADRSRATSCVRRFCAMSGWSLPKS
jgi:hypothetical protein